MYKLLIVDDEPKIVNGLYEQFLEESYVDLEVHRAYSGVEALRIASAVKVDIVLSDIHMPVMSGLELQVQIQALWPRCKFIFLTGYGDFDYIQSALRKGGIDYILKLEDDQLVFDAVHKAFALLQDELKAEQFMIRAERQVREAVPLLRKEYLSDLLEGDFVPGDVTNKRLKELDITLSADENVLLVAGRIDSWREGAMSLSDKSLFLYAVQNIFAEYTSTWNVISFSTRQAELVWFIQPVHFDAAAREEEWRKCETFLHYTLPDIQASCVQLLQVQLSLAISSSACGWIQLGRQYMKLQHILHQGLGRGREVILFEPREKGVQHEGAAFTGGTVHRGMQLIKKIKQLEWQLESGQKEEFAGMFWEIAEIIRSIALEGEKGTLLVEIHYTFGAMFLSYLNRWQLFEEVSASVRTELLLNASLFRTWSEAESYYAGLYELLFSLKTNEQKDRIRQIVSDVNQYIEQHLSEPLSLDILADHVYLHPTYLSKLYKQATSVGVSDWIKDLRIKRAKELLANSRYKVHEIAGSVGFDSGQYFAKVFKKETNFTPQEYRTLRLE
jgi:two-component system response regulator YesN